MPEREANATRNDEQETLARALNLRVPVIAVLAEKALTLAEILELRKDSVISFKKLNTEPLDLYVNDQKIGSGRAIKIGEGFGMWVDQIGTAEETLGKIG